MLKKFFPRLKQNFKVKLKIDKRNMKKKIINRSFQLNIQKISCLKKM